MKITTNTVSGEFFHHSKTIGFYMVFNRPSQVKQIYTCFNLFNAFIESFFSYAN